VLVLILYIVAVVFVYVELFLPGGVFGVLGAVAFVASIFFAFRDYQQMGFWIASVEIVVATILIMIGIKRFPQSHAGKLLILGRNLDKKLGYSGTESFEAFMGRQGETMTSLRPAGIAKIGSRRLDVVTEGAFIDKGKKIRVVAVEGNRVVVREEEDAA
jgi:membrane-bound serine protease (ClpP class)